MDGLQAECSCIHSAIYVSLYGVLTKPHQNALRGTWQLGFMKWHTQLIFTESKKKVVRLEMFKTSGQQVQFTVRPTLLLRSKWSADSPFARSPSSKPSALHGSSAYPRSGANMQAGTTSSAGIAPGRIAASVVVNDAISRENLCRRSR